MFGQQYLLIPGFEDRKTYACEGEYLSGSHCDATCYQSILGLSHLSAVGTVSPEKCGAGGAETPLALSTVDQGGNVGGSQGLFHHPECRGSDLALLMQLLWCCAGVGEGEPG